MDASIQKIKKLIKIMRANGILTLKDGEIELSLAPSALHTMPIKAAAPKKQSRAEQQTHEQDIEQRAMSTLLWSSPMANEIPKVG